MKALAYWVDSSGEVLWSIRMKEAQADLDKYVYNGEALLSSDGNVYIVGSMDKVDSSIDDTFILKLSLDGSLQWLKSYGFYSSAFSV